MYKKLISAAAMTIALVGCDKSNDGKMNDYTFQGAFEPGSYEDFKQTAGDRVFFSTNGTSLSADAKGTLDKQVEWLNKYPNTVFTVEGHCDERGTSEYNLGLGERRAHSVRKYLGGKGLGDARMNTVSFGKERPDDAGHNEAAWSKNRRAVTVVSSGK